MKKPVLPNAVAGHAAQHDTNELPPSGFYFAPGVIEPEAPQRKPRWLTATLELLAEAAILLAIVFTVGVASGVLQSKGWL